MNKKNLYLQAILLISFIAINIFPAGCFSWGPGATTVPSNPVAIPSYPLPNDSLNVNGEAYIKALQCVESNQKALSQDKTDALNIRQQVQSSLLNSKDGNVLINKSEIDNFNKKFPDCKFSALIK